MRPYQPYTTTMLRKKLGYRDDRNLASTMNALYKDGLVEKIGMIRNSTAVWHITPAGEAARAEAKVA
jgi:hypothetical protein